MVYFIARVLYFLRSASTAVDVYSLKIMRDGIMYEAASWKRVVLDTRFQQNVSLEARIGII
jgi:hypothetical protein